MTLFEEWVERTIPMTDKEKTFAWFAWKAAIKSERDACAAIADKYTCGTCGMDGKAGREIRERSNG